MDTRTPPTARGERTRDAVLDAAAELIAEVGWGRTSARAVADRAGVRPGLVHYYFESQEALLAAAAHRAMRRSLAEFVGMLRPDPAASLRQLAAMLESAGGQALVDDASYRLMIEAYMEATREPAVGEVVRQIVRELRESLAALLVETGTPHGDALARATVLAAGLDGIVLHRAVDPDLPARAAVELLLSVVENGQVGR